MKYKTKVHFFAYQIWSSIKKNCRPIKKFLAKFIKKQKKILLTVLSVIIFVIFSLGVVGFTAYWGVNDSQVVNFIVRICPYPAAVVNGHIIKLSDWQEEYLAWKQVSEKQGSAVQPQQIKQDVLDKLINQYFLEKLAKEYDIKITEADFEQELEVLRQEFGGEEALDQAIDELFGWEYEEFQQRVMYPNVLTAKLQTELMDNEQVWQEARKKALQILDKIQQGEDFNQLAFEYSDDTYSAQEGGDLGWFGKGIMVKDFEDAAFSLAVGQISDLIKTDYGYHIIKLDEKMPADEEQGIEEQVKARHILITPKSFSDYMQELVDQAKVWRFIDFDKE